MPSRRSKYDLVEDTYDSRIPLHNDDAFQHGINFTAKYIGTLDVPRPSSRVEIVAAMRRIRYEFKAKAIKKKKVNLIVSVEGVKVCIKKKKKKKQWTWDENKLLVMHHPVYRIFYVSHDSQDMKIFSYICKDGSSNVFKCNVFKSHKKSQAMRIVRTIGQAFEVCHKLSLNHAVAAGDDGTEGADPGRAKVNGRVGHRRHLEGRRRRVESGDMVETDIDLDELEEEEEAPTRPSSATNISRHVTDLDRLRHVPPPYNQIQMEGALFTRMPDMLGTDNDGQGEGEGQLRGALSQYHQRQLMQQQLQQQAQQAQVAIAQVALLQDQLAAETTARIEAQARVHQLLVQNRELIQQQQQLIFQMEDLENQLEMGEAAPPTDTGLDNGLPAADQVPVLTDPMTPGLPGVLSDFDGAVGHPGGGDPSASGLFENRSINMRNNLVAAEAAGQNSSSKRIRTGSVGDNLLANRGGGGGAGSAGSLSLVGSEVNSSEYVSLAQSAAPPPPSQQHARETLTNSFKRLNIANSYSPADPNHNAGGGGRSGVEEPKVGEDQIPSPNNNGGAKLILPVSLRDATSNKLDLNLRSPYAPSRLATGPPPANNNNKEVAGGPPMRSGGGGGGLGNGAGSADDQSPFSSESTVSGESTADNRLASEEEPSPLRPLSRHSLPPTYTFDATDFSIKPTSPPAPAPSDDKLNDTKLHISFSDDENTENSEDSGIPRHTSATESLTFEELEALAAN